MAILITGSAGYVGSHLMSQLDPQVRKECLCPQIEDLDLSDWDALSAYFAAHQITQIVHLAAMINNRNVEGIFKSNIEGLFYLLKLAKQHGVKHFTMVSTNNVYGGSRENILSETEEYDALPGNHYGVSKIAGELMVRELLAQSDTAFAIVRIGDIYGPGNSVCMLIKAVVNNLLEEKPQKLYGQGDRVRDYSYMDDFAKGLALVGQKQLQGIYNLGTGIGTSVAEIIRIAEELSVRREPTVHVDVEKEDHSKVILDVSRLREAGFSAGITLKEGIKMMMESEKNG